MSSLPVGWALATLDDLLASEPRAITDGPFGSNLKSEHYTDSGARVIRLQNIGDGFFRDERAFVSLAHFERLRAHEVRSGDLVVASLGEELPRACLVPRLDVPAIVKADCIRVRLHPSIETRWVLYCLIAPQTRRLATARIKGVGRPRLGLGQLRQLSIPVPPLAEQRRIIETLEGHLSQLDAADGYLSRAKNRIPALRGSVREHAIEHQAEYLLLPASGAGWHRGTLGDVVTRIEAGKSFVCQPRPAEPDEWGVIKVSAMTWGQFQESENKAVPTDRLVDPRFEIRAGDVLVSRANTEQYVGAPVLVGQCRPRLLLSDKSLRLVPRGDVDPRWLEGYSQASL